MAEEQSPIRFYKLANTTAAEVLTTIRSLEGEQTIGAAGRRARPARSRQATARANRPEHDRRRRRRDVREPRNGLDGASAAVADEQAAAVPPRTFVTPGRPAASAGD